MTDVTLIYYTANRIDLLFARRVREQLLVSWSKTTSDGKLNTEREHAVCVSHGALESVLIQRFGPSFNVGTPEPSIWQVYQNILIGAKAATTPFIACCEDDTVYAPSHFDYRPALDTFAYDRNRWVITKRRHPQTGAPETIYYWRQRHQMAMCIAPRQLLIETLEEKFAKYPTPAVSTDVAKKAGWGEPGRYEKNLKLTPRKLEYFDSPEPSVTFNHRVSLMGRRQWKETDIIKTELPPWGNADALWSRIHG